MSNFSQFVAYFKSLAERNIDIAHSDDNQMRKFFRVDIDEFYMSAAHQLPGKDHGPFMVLFNPKRVIKRIEKVNNNMEIMFMILRNYSNNDFNDESEAYDICENVLNEILAKIGEENETDQFLKWSFNWDVDIDAVKLVTSTGKYVGWQAHFFLNRRISTCVDSNKWLNSEP